MNGIDNITGRIISEAREKASELLARAQYEANEIKANFGEIARKEAEQIVLKGEDAAGERERRLRGVAELEARKTGLKTKQDMIGEAFQKAIENLRNQPDEDYIKTLVSLACMASQTGDEEVILSSADRERFGERLIKAVNKKIKDLKPKAALTLSDETRDISGGLILRSGDMEINATFETIIGMLREEIAQEVANLLFN